MKLSKLTPPQAITLSFAIVVLVGAFLLSLPVSSASGDAVPFLTALFTSTSATCVTGLATEVTATYWSPFGKIIILLLIQVGGLGLITFLSLGTLLLKRRLSLKTQLLVQSSYNQDQVGTMAQFLKNVVLCTVVIEAAGACLLTIGFAFAGMPWMGAVQNGVFHAVSAFCNAGFDNIGSASLVPYRENGFLVMTIALLVIFGGIGFPVWIELVRFVCGRGGRRSRLSLHLKLAVVTTAVLLGIGMAGFLAFEWSNEGTLGGLSVLQKLHNAFFQSVTLRTAGFATVDMSHLRDVTKFLAALFMLVGGSPSGTAGGIKTVTLAIIFSSMLSAIRGKRNTEAFGRTIPHDLLQKALTVTATMFVVVIVAALALSFTEPNAAFLDLWFECCSAAGTVGISANLTTSLSYVGQCIIILVMFIGRLSPVTVVVALNLKQKQTTDAVTLAKERVIVG
jgi:trk system potassium uptake protein TrkH